MVRHLSKESLCGESVGEKELAEAVNGEGKSGATAQTEDDGDEEDDWAEGVAIHPSSVDGPLPGGTVFGSIKRMRSTINTYTDKVEDSDWYVTFKVGTLQALQRRLGGHADDVEGKFQVDVVVGFRQCRARVSALIHLHKALKMWMESRREEQLCDVLPPMQVIKKYLNFVEKEMSPELQVIEVMARMRQAWLDTGSLSEAVALCDVPRVMRLLQRIGSQAVEVKKECSEIAEGEDQAPTLSMETSNGAGKKPPGRPRKQPKPDMDLRNLFTLPVADQVAQLAIDIVKAAMHNFSADFQSDGECLERFINDLGDFLEAWSSKTANIGHVENFSELVSAIKCILESCRADERRRPPTLDVRGARKVIFGMVKSDGCWNDLAKAMVTYSGCSVAMQLSKDYSMAGLEDEQATTLFHSACEALMNELDPLSDMDKFVFFGNSGAAHNTKSILPLVGHVQTMTTNLLAIIPRWSSTSLQMVTRDILATISNQCEVMHICVYLVADSAYRAFKQYLPRAHEHHAVHGTITPTRALANGTEVKQEAPETAEAHIKEEPGEVDTSVVPTSTEPAENPAVALNKVDAASFARTADQVMRDTESFVATLRPVLDGIKVTITTMEGRAGEIRSSMSEDDCPVLIEKELRQNSDAVILMCEYVKHAAFLDEVREHVDKIPFGSRPQTSVGSDQAFVDNLCGMSRRHLRIKGNNDLLAIKTRCLSTDIAVMRSFAEEFRLFVDNFGQSLYDRFAINFVHVTTERILAMAYGVSIVHPKVITEAAAADVLSHMIAPNALRSLIAEEETPLMNGTISDFKVYDICDRNMRGVENLKEFAESVGMKTIDLHCPSTGMPPVPLDLERGLCLLRTLCCARRTAVASVWLHKGLMTKELGKVTIPQHKLFGQICHLARAFNHFMVEFDGLIECDIIIGLEQERLPLKIPLALWREWKKLMSVYGGRVVQVLLQWWAHEMDKATAVLQAATPSWKSAFPDNNTFNMDLAKRILHGKLAPLAKAHNSLHQLLTQMNTSAKALEVSPRLQDNDITAESCAVATTALSASGTASAVILGYELLSEPVGPGTSVRATAYLEKNRNAQHKEVPDVFWREFEHLQAVAGGPGGAACAASPGKPAIKQPSEKAFFSPASEKTTRAPSVGDKRPPSSDGKSVSGTPESSGSGSMTGGLRVKKLRQ